MNKMIKELLPNIRVANEAREVRHVGGLGLVDRLGLRPELNSQKPPA